MITEPSDNKKDWLNSKYCNIWMRKTCPHPSELYMTKLMSEFYNEAENLFKVRSPANNAGEIFVKFIPNVEVYRSFRPKLGKLAKENKEEYLRAISKIDNKSLVKMLFSNLLICNTDVNNGNLLIKHFKEKTSFIPIDFAKFDHSKYQNIIKDLIQHITNNDIESAKNDLVKYGNMQLAFKKESSINFTFDLKDQLNNISNEEFIEIISNMFKNFDKIKIIIADYQKDPGRKDPEIQYSPRELMDNLISIKKAIDICKENYKESKTSVGLYTESFRKRSDFNSFVEDYNNRKNDNKIKQNNLEL